MENNELQHIWKNMDATFKPKSKDELNLLLIAKTRKTTSRFLYVSGISGFVSAGLIVFLIITALHRINDVYYLVINLTLCLFAIFGFISSLYEWYKMQNTRFNQPLKSWLEERIRDLTKELTGRFRHLYILLIPILYCLVTLSIHVYFENKTFIEVLHTEESVVALIVGAPVGLFVSYYCSKKIRKYYGKILTDLKELHSLFGKVEE